MDCVMAILLLYRHAKSSWDDWSLADIDRPLNQRGQQAAPLMGAFIKQHGYMPDHICCSPALRTRQTLELTGFDTPQNAIDYPKDLFHAQDMTLLEIIRNTDQAVKQLGIIAHNPGLHSLAEHLASLSADPDEQKRLKKKFPTAALAVFQINANSWRDIEPATCELLHFTTPKLLKQKSDLRT